MKDKLDVMLIHNEIIWIFITFFKKKYKIMNKDKRQILKQLTPDGVECLKGLCLM